MGTSASLKAVGSVALVMLALQIANFSSGYHLNHFGLVPRELIGLPGILVAPLLHGSWSHLIGNLLPFLVLSLLVLREGLARYLAVSALVIGLGGLLVWCLGRTSIHVGASGWVFGLWAYILARAWHDRSLQNLIAAMVVALFYGGMVFGFIPRAGVSVESHVAGAITGILAARFCLARPQPA